MSENKYKFGIIGLGVMGRSLALNVARNGYPTAVWNRETEWIDRFLDGDAHGKEILGFSSLKEFADALERPRKVLLMVKSGAPVDWTIESVKPYLSSGDILIEGGNSHFRDTARRNESLTEAGLHFVGMGVSGGEEGALWGPSLMPGGDPAAYQKVGPLLEVIAAKVDDGPCVTHCGPGGAGHFVKMVHNGIEYGDMQLIAESYDLLRRLLKLSAQEIAQIFEDWNQGPLNSYLIEITAEILRVVEPETGKPLVELILDQAGQKGTGKWTAQEALEQGVAVSTIQGAIEARILSGEKEMRMRAGQRFPHDPALGSTETRESFVPALAQALYASKVCSYAQGMALLQRASSEYQWGVNLSEVSRIWKGGCIIRAGLLEDIQNAFLKDPDLENLLLEEGFAKEVETRQTAWRDVVCAAQRSGVPVPALSSSLAYFDLCRSPVLPLNLTQAQRDYFGAHTYRRVDRPDQGAIHTDWKSLIASR